MQYKPFASLLVHIPNGQNVGEIHGARLKKAGLRAGFPDLVLFLPTKTHHGLCIELKTDVGVASALQKDMIARLNEEGYKALVCKGFDAAYNVLDSYMSEYICSKNATVE